MGCQEKPTSRHGATDPPFPAPYRAAAACPALPRLRPMVSREDGGFQHSDGRRVPRPTRSLSECWKPRQVSPPFLPSRRLFRAFNGRRVPSPTRRLLEGRESRPESPFPQRPRAFTPPAAAPEKPKKKGTLPDAPWFRCPNSSQSPDTPACLLRTRARLAHCNSLSSCEPCTGRNTW